MERRQYKYCDKLKRILSAKKGRDRLLFITRKQCLSRAAFRFWLLCPFESTYIARMGLIIFGTLQRPGSSPKNRLVSDGNDPSSRSNFTSIRRNFTKIYASNISNFVLVKKNFSFNYRGFFLLFKYFHHFVSTINMFIRFFSKRSFYFSATK